MSEIRKMQTESYSGFSTSMSLLDLAKKHDETAWKRLTELYGPLVYHWCRKSGLSPEDSADLVQDVYRTLVKHIVRFEKTEESGSFRAWLWTITRNRIRDHLRQNAEKALARGGSTVLQKMHNIPDMEPDEFDDSGVSAVAGLHYRALEIVKREIKEPTWNAFWRSTIDEIDPVTVAAECNMSVASVWQAKSRVLRRLRQLLT
jgi:RNA polymerase sigma-70 factor, ECF subfamily